MAKQSKIQEAQQALYKVMADYPGEKGTSPEAMDAMMKVFADYPILQQDQRYQRLYNRINQIQPGTQAAGQFLADVFDVVTSSKDINIADKRLKELVPPTLPTAPDARRLDARLNEARLREATAGATERAITERVTDDQYLQDLANAQVASTGQAAAYGSYAQAAANRRARNRLAARTNERAAVNEQSQRVDALTAERQRAEEQKYFNRLRAAQILENRYNLDREYAHNLGQMGRQSRRNALHNMVQPLSTMLSEGIARWEDMGGTTDGAQNLADAKANAAEVMAPLQKQHPSMIGTDPLSNWDGWKNSMVTNLYPAFEGKLPYLQTDRNLARWQSGIGPQVREYNPADFAGYTSPEDATAQMNASNDAKRQLNRGPQAVQPLGPVTQYQSTPAPLPGAYDWGSTLDYIQPHNTSPGWAY